MRRDGENKVSNSKDINKIICRLVTETSSLNEDNKKRGRCSSNISLFWAILDNHFAKKGSEEAFSNIMADEMQTDRTVIYAWNRKGRIPPKYKFKVEEFFEAHKVTLPIGVTFGDLFENKEDKSNKIRRKKINNFNSALYAHLNSFFRAFDHNYLLIQERLLMSKVNLLNLPLLMRWVFETGGIASTRVRAYMAFFIESPELQSLREEYGFVTVKEGVEYARRHGWIAEDDDYDGDEDY